jgi:hypothetical protein
MLCFSTILQIGNNTTSLHSIVDFRVDLETVSSIAYI